MPGAALSADERAHHALQRLAYGPTPQDAAALRELAPTPGWPAGCRPSSSRAHAAA